MWVEKKKVKYRSYDSFICFLRLKILKVRKIIYYFKTIVRD